MIKARGVKNGRSIEVEYKDNKVYFNGVEDSFLTDEVEYELSLIHAVGGTYFPQKYEPVNAINVLRNHFFDGIGEVETDEEVRQLESEYERVY